MKISVAVITFNEERLIGTLLNAVAEIADEIIIVDSFSTDKTEEICKSFPKVKFIKRKFDGFGKQKNFALEHCSGAWIFFPDADEIPDDLAKKFMSKIANSSNTDCDVYNIEFNNIFLGKTLKYGGWGNTWRERFFRNGSGKFTDDIVHESYKTTGKTGKIAGKIQHFTYRDIHHHIEKSNKYTTMMAEKMYLQGKTSSITKIIIKPAFQFLKSYLLRLGFLDGLVGYYAAKTAAFYTFLKYMKLYEIQNRK